MNPRFRLLRLSDVDADLTEKWKRLADHAIEPNPYHDPRFLVTSARHRDDARALRIGVVEHGSDLRALLAFGIEPAVVGNRLRAMSTRGPFMQQVGDLRHPLLARENAVQSWEYLLTGLHDSALPGFLQLENFPGDGPLSSSLYDAARNLRIPVVERERDSRALAHRTDDRLEFAAELCESPRPDTASFVTDHSSSSARKRRATLVRRLEEFAGSPLRIEDRASDPGAIEHFLDLEAAGWKGSEAANGRALRITENDRWFADVAAAFQADGKLAVLTLIGAGPEIYMSVNFKAGDGLFGCLDTYDERFAAFSPGALGRIAEWHRALAEPGVRFFDPNLSSVYAESTRLYPHRRPHVTLLLGTGGIAARTAVGSFPAVRRMRRAAGRGARVIGLRPR